jgi:hypothetical protein
MRDAVRGRTFTDNFVVPMIELPEVGARSLDDRWQFANELEALPGAP